MKYWPPGCQTVDVRDLENSPPIMDVVWLNVSDGERVILASECRRSIKCVCLSEPPVEKVVEVISLVLWICGPQPNCLMADP